MQYFSDIAKKAKQILSFKSVISGEKVEFPAFITRFEDSYSIGWGGGSPVFGRTDPVKTYQSTSRRISVSFDILGESFERARENFINFSKLVKMQYPMYSEPIAKGENNARTIKAAPMMRIKYVNYINSGFNEDGLLGFVGGFTFAPDFNAGHFDNGPNGDLIPLKYSVSFVFEPVHEQPLGASIDAPTEFFDQTFPYNQERSNSTTAQPAVSKMNGTP